MDKLVVESDSRHKFCIVRLRIYYERAVKGEFIALNIIKNVIEHIVEDLQESGGVLKYQCLKNEMEGRNYSISNLKNRLYQLYQLFPQISKLS